LLDADPASNTLSWRWAAGLHTRGKHCLARAANICDKTQGRFDPTDQLNERAGPLVEDGDTPAAGRLASGDKIIAKRVALLLTEEDLHSESWALGADVAGCAALSSASVAAPGSPSALFSEAALDDGLTRAASHFGATADLINRDQIVAWATSLAVEEVVTAYAPQGLVRWSLDELQQQLSHEGIRLVRLQRDFDARVWPHARAGFFKLNEKIPSFIAGAP
jgi:deoxyribodipyrimidine photo-lyase